jgi:hypothetical protein
MKIREGAYYRTRGGDVVGPMKPVTVANDAPHPRYVWGCFGRTWTDSGDYDFGAGYLEEDLISEVYVSDTPPADAPAPEVKNLRDEFAMEAMKLLFPKYGADWVEVMLAIAAYKQADAMMEARKK